MRFPSKEIGKGTQTVSYRMQSRTCENGRFAGTSDWNERHGHGCG